MALRSKDTIIKAALLRCGRSDAGGDSLVREAITANYDEIVRAGLESSDGALPFGRVMETLTSRNDGVNGYDDAYSVSNGALHICEVYLDDCPASDLQEPWEYDGVNRRILVSSRGRSVSVKVIKDGLEYTWSSEFAKSVQRSIEAVIKDVLEEPEESAAKDQEADFSLLKANVKGSKGRSPRRLYKKGGGRLSRARFTEDRR